ncbi:hypothetical protein P7C71_g2152, partial [Lecanoromycetidae sp. Uapishka_2]
MMATNQEAAFSSPADTEQPATNDTGEGKLVATYVKIWQKFNNDSIVPVEHDDPSHNVTIHEASPRHYDDNQGSEGMEPEAPKHVHYTHRATIRKGEEQLATFLGYFDAKTETFSDVSIENKGIWQSWIDDRGGEVSLEMSEKRDSRHQKFLQYRMSDPYRVQAGYTVWCKRVVAGGVTRMNAVDAAKIGVTMRERQLARGIDVGDEGGVGGGN